MENELRKEGYSSFIEGMNDANVEKAKRIIRKAQLFLDNHEKAHANDRAPPPPPKEAESGLLA